MRREMFIALLRAINVSGRNRVPMAELRAVSIDLGWQAVQTYIQSGNVVFQADASPAKLEAALESAIERRFGHSVPAIVRRAADWSTYVGSNPFPEASQREPKAVMLGLAKAAPKADAVNVLRERASGGEQVAQTGDALWIHYADGMARTKLTPSLLDRAAGSPVTLRNWRTVLTLQGMATTPPS